MTAILFSGLVLVVAVLVAIGLRRSARLGPLAVSGLLFAYLAVPGMLAAAGALDRYTPLPAPALLVVLALTLCTVAFCFSPLGTRLAAGASLGAVVALQAFRIPVELMLHRLHTEGIVPVQMTYVGRNFDILTGISGLLLGAWLLSGRPVPRQVVLAWNVLGIALLANIVITAVLSTPVPFRRFLDQPPHTLPSTFPFVWLPSFLVQVALGSHLLVFRRLRMNKRSVAP
jgi:hypothetical protein